MKKFSEKIKNDKGFSLVELIVVVAIMAVLMAVLVPTLVRNVEKTRVQKDKSAISEVRQAVITAMAQEKFQDASASTTGATVTSGQFTLAALFATDTTSAALADEVEATIGSDKVSLTSSMKKDAKVKIEVLDTRKGQCTISVDADGTENDFYLDVDGEHAGTYSGGPTSK